ncbi:response regulator [Flavobacterium sp. PLA-1-15]|uniref:response regulator n=1 Tax=Flavobacterium sp. PLA-1-15 TaxID=3380533 RepID=UPI003B82570C
MIRTNNLHIVIAEDDTDDTEIILESFSRHSSFTKISLVKNGKELIDFLNSDEEKPDVILTDINMPVVNGIEALKEISRNSEMSQIISFAYSTSINILYQKKCLQYGAKAFIIKPGVIGEFERIPYKIMEVINSLQT